MRGAFFHLASPGDFSNQLEILQDLLLMPPHIFEKLEFDRQKSMAVSLPQFRMGKVTRLNGTTQSAEERPCDWPKMMFL